MDKMITTDKDTTISNDGATILNLLDIEHPAAKILVDIAKSQDSEVGDGYGRFTCPQRGHFFLKILKLSQNHISNNSRWRTTERV
jgi:hypothetical protein